MKFYNSLSRKKEKFKSLVPGKAGLYTCGPTVYDFAHIGNFRAYIFEDILRRALEYRGYEVTQVMNLTDVDDKTIRGANENGVSLQEFTEKYKDSFFKDIEALGIEPAEYYPAATDHIPEVISLVEKLFEKGLTYKSDDGSVYFSVAKFPEYGNLAHIDKEGLRAGVRISNDEYEKDAVGDFAVWKAWDEDDGNIWWDSPWGRGRPGWHIECSAMSMKYLGESFDIHTGGIDNMFPHHENEIAQSEGATGKPFVHTWLHCAHLRVNGEKMAKSKGNFYTLRDLIEKGYTGREIRYVLISGQYRQPINFTFDGLAAARSALSRIDEFVRLAKDTAGDTESSGKMPGWIAESLDAFGAALDDDLNVPLALAALFSLIGNGNRAASAGELSPENAAHALDALRKIDTVLNVVFRTEEAVPEEVETLLVNRQEARLAKNWAESDRIRDEIATLGWIVKDTPDGQKLSPK
ncbi:MAG: cysteine--tRNA ligase [Lentisphaerae bacterium]|nr:cysteine--tRNA ligase [Lentisphaerota bacterium]